MGALLLRAGQRLSGTESFHRSCNTPPGWAHLTPRDITSWAHEIPQGRRQPASAASQVALGKLCRQDGCHHHRSIGSASRKGLAPLCPTPEGPITNTTSQSRNEKCPLLEPPAAHRVPQQPSSAHCDGRKGPAHPCFPPPAPPTMNFPVPLVLANSSDPKMSPTHRPRRLSAIAKRGRSWRGWCTSRVRWGERRRGGQTYAVKVRKHFPRRSKIEKCDGNPKKPPFRSPFPLQQARPVIIRVHFLTLTQLGRNRMVFAALVSPSPSRRRCTPHRVGGVWMLFVGGRPSGVWWL